ncbi:LemA protein [Cohaesibacter sp. ES.047]|uniref:LemA family protein n=1 Tax=Cohaesibacter sp. ES.047 TaxID=1798205 RepID=UPI000BB6E8D9|nr:LemA family protein [Cohaesibacter sp. ES.047]SNY92474.1 LemA protein [Cohaesibacter sp. ES.047]
MAISWVLLAIIVALGLYAILIYNKLVKTRQMVDEGWSGIDVQLKRRSNLIPNLVETVKGYMGHERETLEKVTEMRARAAGAAKGGAAERAQAEGNLSKALVNLMAVAENYPDLKANDGFLNLQRELSGLEDEIQLARRYYNGTVRNLNTMIDQFPSNIIAGFFSYAKKDYFELENEADRATPQVQF